MSVYKKLQKARVLLNASSIKKSGKNKFAGYEYFELGDFIPTVNEIFDSVGLCGVVNFGEQATLTVYDTDGDGQVTFSSPLVFAENAKGQAIQSLGSTHTYFRRYLWLLALELTEHDSIDSLPQEDKPKPIEVKPKVKPDTGDAKVITGEPDPNKVLLVDSLVEFGEGCETLSELTQLWKANQGQIDDIKSTEKSEYKRLQERFAEIKAKFKE
jgi:hypothetical protein